jgi:hypoxanthine phosphoribosyltransferase
VELGDEHVLVVDDVADTGETLKLVADTIRSYVGDLRTAVLYEKSRSVVRADYVWRRTERWIDFPWSTLPPVEGGGTHPA